MLTKIISIKVTVFAIKAELSHAFAPSLKSCNQYSTGRAFVNKGRTNLVILTNSGVNPPRFERHCGTHLPENGLNDLRCAVGRVDPPVDMPALNIVLKRDGLTFTLEVVGDHQLDFHALS